MVAVQIPYDRRKAIVKEAIVYLKKNKCHFMCIALNRAGYHLYRYVDASMYIDEFWEVEHNCNLNSTVWNSALLNGEWIDLHYPRIFKRHHPSNRSALERRIQILEDVLNKFI